MLGWAMFRRMTGGALILLLCCLPIAGVNAENRGLPNGRIWLAAMDSAAAARAAESQTGGKALSVSAEQRNGSTVYRVKVLLPGGRIKIVYIGG